MDEQTLKECLLIELFRLAMVCRFGRGIRVPHAVCRQTAFAHAFCLLANKMWWVEEDLNLRPHAYQACALTT